MSSYDTGKDVIIEWIHEHFQRGSSCLDVGACDGKWAALLCGYLQMDACEVWEPNAKRLVGKYDHIFIADIKDLPYAHYDLVIFGDVLEHMSVTDAQSVLEHAAHHSADCIVAVPYNYYQDEIYGNPYERHIQPDLTPEIVLERYPQLEPIVIYPGYGYYHRK